MADWELVAVDDGSTDHTGAILQELAGLDRRIRVLRQANSGIAAARNAAMEVARGEFVAFLDSDDLWEPDFLSVLLDALVLHEHAAVAWCDFTRFDDATGKIRPVAWRNYTLTGNTFHNMLIHVDTHINCVLVHRESLVKAKVRFDPHLVCSEDLDFLLQVFCALPDIHVPRVLYRYRVRDGSASADYRRMLYDEARMLERHINLPDVPDHVRRRARSMFAFKRAVVLAFAGREFTSAVRCYVNAVRLEPGNPNLYLLPLRKLWLGVKAGLGG